MEKDPLSGLQDRQETDGFDVDELCCNFQQLRGPRSTGLHTDDDQTDTTSRFNHVEVVHDHGLQQACYNPVTGLAVDPLNSAILLDIIQTSAQGLKTFIFESLVKSIDVLMIHRYGHGFFIELIPICDDYWLEQITFKITQNIETFISLSKNKYGSKSLMALISAICWIPLVNSITSSLSVGFFDLMTDEAGSKVLFKCLAVVSADENKPLYNAALDNCIALATHETGCFKLKNFIENAMGIYRDMLLNIVAEQSVFLSQHATGNYMVQNVLDYRNVIFCNKIFKELRGYYVRLSMQKAGSFVVEKCLMTGGVEFVVMDFIVESERNFLHLSKDQFGNYVIQKTLKVLRDTRNPLYAPLVGKLVPLQQNLYISGHGRNIVKLISPQVFL